MRRLPILLVLLAAVGVFAPSLGYGFVYDDHVQVQANPWLQGPDGFRRLFTEPFWGFYRDRDDLPTNYYRPVYGSVYALTARAFGVSPLPFHAVSLALHALVTLLAAATLPRLGASPPERSALAAGPLGPTLVAGLAFALHPAHAEAAAWIGGQADLLAALFSLLALRAYLASRDEVRPGARRLALLLGPLAFLLAALSKETGAAFLLVPVAIELAERRLPGPRTPGARGVALRLGAYGLALAAYLALRLQALGALAPRHYGVTGGAAAAPAYAFDLFGRYLLHLVAPFPPRVLAQVPRPEGWPPEALAGLAAALLLAGLAAFLARRGTGPRRGVVPLAFVVAFLLPVLAADAIGGANFAERYLYLPSIGLAWLAGLAAARIARSPRRRPGEEDGAPGGAARGGAWKVAAASAVAVFLAGATVVRARIYGDDLSLFTAAVATSPASYIARNNLGMALYGAGRLDEAEVEYRAALRLSPRSVAPRANLGLAAERRAEAGGGAPELERAARLYREALALSPRHALSALRLSRLERRRGDREGAARTLDRFLAAGGESYDTLCERAELWLAAGRPEAARPLLRRAAAAFPDRPRARRLLALLPPPGSPRGATE